MSGSHVHSKSSLPGCVITALLALLAQQGCGSDAGNGNAAGHDASGAGAAAGSAGSDDPDAGDDAGVRADCDAGAVPAFADVAIFDKCATCHGIAVSGDARNDAPPDVNFDDYASAVRMSENAARYVFHGIMPPTNSGIRVSETEKQQLYLWALCGTPE